MNFSQEYKIIKMFALPPSLLDMNHEIKQKACDDFNNRYVPIVYNDRILFKRKEPTLNLKEREINKIKRTVPSFGRILFEPSNNIL